MAEHNQVNMPSMGRRPGGGGPARFAPSAKAKDAKKTFHRILKIYLGFGRPLAAAVLFTIAAAGISVAVPYFVGQTFNTFQKTAHTVDGGLLYSLLLLLAMLHLANWFIGTANGVIMLKVSQRLVNSLRSEFFEKMQRLPLAFFDTHSHGDTMSRLTNDADNISSTIAQATTQIISCILTLTGSLAVMVWLSVPLTLIVLLCVPLVFLLTRTIASRSRTYFLAQQKKLGALNGIIEENILGIKMVKAFGRQKYVTAQFSAVNHDLCESSRKAQIWSGFMMPLMNVINNFVFTLVAVSGGYLSVKTGLAVGTVVSFLSYSKQFAQPLNSVAGMFNTIQSALAGAERVFEILDETGEAPDVPGAVMLQKPYGNVLFDRVDFSYDGKTSILRQISFEVKAGETVALVGETGAGKTTIVNLLTRFYDADSGSIQIDGTDIRNIRRNSLRSCFSVVLQETCLFTGTILDNIRYSKTNASKEEVIRAAKLARAHPFIEKLPQGYQTMVSGSADNLSQGQRQLLAIARALLCDCPILILDEATSSVDTKTEKDIQKALLHLMKGKTSFLIAHRLSTIRDADRIFVIGGGTILESGTHETLMKLHGSYYEMVASQTGNVMT